MKEIEFEGILSGDYECFCWDVEKQIFQTIKKTKPDKYSKSQFNKKLFRLYPNDVFNNIEMNTEGKKYKFKISIEEIM